MSGCCRIDPIHHGGIYIPLLAPVFRCLPPPLSFFLPLRSPSRAHQPHHRRGGFSRATAYAATFLGALAQASLPLPFLPSPRLCNYQDPLATPPPPPSFRRIARRCNGHCLRVKSFHPRRNDIPPEIVARSGRFHDFLELPIVRSRASTTGEAAAFVGRERAAIEGDLPACELRLPFEAFAFIRTRDFRDVSFRVIYEISENCLFILSLSLRRV